MNKKSKLTRNSKHSQSDLIQLADKFANSAERDSKELSQYGPVKERINRTKKLRDEFELIPSDEEIQAEVATSKDKKDLALNELKSAMIAVLRRISLHFGKNSPEMKKAGGENLSNMTDAEYCQKGRRLERVGRQYEEALKVDGLTKETLDNLKAKTDVFDDLIDKIKDLAVKRDIKTQERTAKANDLYSAIVKLSEMGKAAFEETDPSRYKDYIINDKPTKRNTTEGTEEENEDLNEE